MRIGIFGGTFDPVHMGHLILAEQCRAQAGLDQVWFVPSYAPPHKAKDITRFEQRCEMIELAIAGHPAFQVNRIEKELPPPSFTANTLTELHTRHPGNEFFLLMGSDCLPDLPGWYEPRQVVERAGLVVVPRPGVMLWTAARLAQAMGVPESAVRLQFVACPMIEIASRELRRAITDGMSIRYLVPRSVEEYARERKLYAAV
ncbi:Nicotinate-nucleotide adenylyltransferase [Gemmata obscuriglobus]|uniref:Probable nicotinate-nucleotide adenylyltransferase n=1 Tax=Gemmata obscuriglobus TaxID=114 RepID=A0A2Z3GVW1_9BACT|nr:nicotinate-nucleotide adenylyltransferase [Gemmata obscuriglobus]AWM37458.1 nicotinate (nicotinamide) nucleotide adenylyltransferase [Gemmata obscuriglobus]QEG29777.1 Nicotinate-nucleotide adenylyltransferase [Gemmata obscuriglobus]VTS09094.1 nicotinate-nucleotide adenylyltransferase : Probable nicotinate-nucleotide adenylyltransferase OS=Gemmata sp. Wa1-1 GN=nadD PE=3 SV=1: CTP_transf_2 [Gemmata obscuriglobus UQM 2246]